MFLLRARATLAARTCARSVSSLSEFATLDVFAWDGRRPHAVHNLLSGEWAKSADGPTETIINPLDGEPFLKVPLTGVSLSLVLVI